MKNSFTLNLDVKEKQILQIIKIDNYKSSTMHIVNQVLIIVVSLLFLYIMYLETITTSSIKTSKIFNIPQEILREKHFTTLMKKLRGSIMV